MALWTPTEITTNLWLDAADTNTITLDGSSNVENWEDKSGQSNHFSQTTAGDRPAIGSINTVDAINFSTPAYLTSPSITALWSTSNLTIITVICPRTFRTNSPYFHTIISQGGYTVNDFYFCADSRANSSPIVSTDGAMYRLDGSASITDEIPVIIGLVGQNGSQSMFVDAELNTSGTIGSGWDYVIGSREATLGHDLDGRALEGDIGEILVINDTVSETDRQKIEGYLAHKWGLTANLTTTHPYKNYAPAISFHTFSGYVQVEGIPAVRPVLMYDRSTYALEAWTTSASGTGYFELETTASGTYFINILPELDDGYNIIVYDKINLV